MISGITNTKFRIQFICNTSNEFINIKNRSYEKEKTLYYYMHRVYFHITFYKKNYIISYLCNVLITFLIFGIQNKYNIFFSRVFI